MKNRAYRQAGWMGLVGMMVCAALLAQQPPPPAEKEKPPEKAKANPKKVWTADGLRELRRPRDEYERRKGEEEAQAKAAAAKASVAKAEEDAEPKKEGGSFRAPKTLEEAEHRLEQKYYEVQAQAEAIERVHQELLKTDKNDVRIGLQSKIDQMTNDMEEGREELKLLEANVEKLKARMKVKAEGK